MLHLPEYHYHSSPHDVPPSPGGDYEVYSPDNGSDPSSLDHPEPDGPEELNIRPDQPEYTGGEDDQRGSGTAREDEITAIPRSAPGAAIPLPAGILPPPPEEKVDDQEDGTLAPEATPGEQNNKRESVDEDRIDPSAPMGLAPVLPGAVHLDMREVAAQSAQDVVAPPSFAAGEETTEEGGEERRDEGNEKASPRPGQPKRSHNDPPAPPGRRPPGLEGGQDPDESDLREQAMLQTVVDAMLQGENRDPNPHEELTPGQAYEHAVITDIINTLGAFASLGPRDISYIPEDLLYRPPSTQRLEHNMQSIIASTAASSDPLPPELAGFNRVVATLYSADFLQTLQDESEFAHAARIITDLHELEDRREGGRLHGRPIPSLDEHFGSQMLAPTEMERCVRPLIESIVPDPEGAADFSVSLSGTPLFSDTVEKAIAWSILTTAQELVVRHIDPIVKTLMSPTEIWSSVEVWDRAHITARENGLESETASQAIPRVMSAVRHSMRQSFEQQHQEFLATARMRGNKRKEE